MNFKRLYNSLISPIIINPKKRANYFKNRKIYRHIGENVIIQTKRMPLYPKLISIDDNTIIASNVMFLTHDVVHSVLNKYLSENIFSENIGCISIGKNCFIGSNTSILYNIKIGDNSIVSAGSIVTKDIPNGEIWGGVPAKKIGTIDDYIMKLKNNPKYPNHLKPKNLEIDLELEEFMWKKFVSDRQNKN